jgi:hypothetical protein
MDLIVSFFILVIVMSRRMCMWNTKEIKQNFGSTQYDCKIAVDLAEASLTEFKG